MYDASDPRFVIKLKPTEEQLLRWCSVVVPQLKPRNIITPRRVKRVVHLIAPVAIVYILYGLFCHISLELGYYVQTPIVARGLLATGGAYFLARCYFTWRSWRLDREIARLSLAEAALMPGRFRETTVTIDMQGFAYSDNHRTYSVSWDALVELEERDSILVFTFDAGDVNYLPLECVEPDQLEMLLGFLDDHIDTEAALDHVAQEHMKTRRLSCWKCAYEMRGLLQAKCPECGSGLDLKDLAKAQLIA